MTLPPGPKRVVVVTSHLGFGGAERQTVALLRKLHGTPWAPIRVISLSDDVEAHSATLRELNYPISIIRRRRSFDLVRCRELRGLLIRDEAEVVHAVNWFASGYAILATTRRARVVSSIRNSHMPAGVVRRCIFPRLVRRSAGVLVNSEQGRQMLLNECGMEPERITLVPNGIDVDHLRSTKRPGALRRELNIPSDAPIVAYVGRNARVKNIPRLLDVVSRLLPAHPRLHVVITGIGLGPEAIAATELAAVPRLHCLGPRHDVPSLLCDATVLLLTSDSEGMPNVILEAFAASVPVVATAVGDIPQMVPPGCGELSPPDAAQLTFAVLRVVANAPSYRCAVDRYSDYIQANHSVQAMATGTVNVWKTAALRA